MPKGSLMPQLWPGQLNKPCRQPSVCPTLVSKLMVFFPALLLPVMYHAYIVGCNEHALNLLIYVPSHATPCISSSTVMLQTIASPIPFCKETKASKRRQSTSAEMSDSTSQLLQGLRLLHATESCGVSVSPRSAGLPSSAQHT